MKRSVVPLVLLALSLTPGHAQQTPTAPARAALVDFLAEPPAAARTPGP